MSEDSSNSVQNASKGSSFEHRIKVDFNDYGVPVGNKSTKLSTRIGVLVRTHVPIKYKSWKKVPRNYIDDIWNALLKEYDVPELFRKKCELSMPADFRKHKTKLRKMYYDSYPTHDQRVANPPPMIRPEDWRSFCESENIPDAQQRRKKNKESRLKLTYSHTSGRLGYARVEEKMKKERGDSTMPISRTEVWVKNHTKKDGTIPKGVAPYMEAINNIIKSQTDEGSTTSFQSILDDPLSKVFGKDSNGRVRGVGSTISRTQIECSAPALAKVASTQSENSEWRSEINKINSTLGIFITEMQEMKALYQSNSGTYITPINATTKGGTNSVSIPAPSNVEMNCELLNWTSDVVATGRVLRDQTQGIGHGHVLRDTEEKVVLDKILLPEENLYLRSQGGATNLEDIGIGGILVWPKVFIKYC